MSLEVGISFVDIMYKKTELIFENPSKTWNRSKIFGSLIGEYESYYWAEFEASPIYNVKIQLIISWDVDLFLSFFLSFFHSFIHSFFFTLHCLL